MKAFFPRYLSWICPAILASVLVFPLLLPNFFMEGYDGIYVSAISDEEHYVSLAREVSEGNWFHRNTYLLEEKSAPINIVQWGDLITGGLFRVWIGTVGGFVLLMKWLGVFLTAFLLWKLMERIAPGLSSGWNAASVTAFFILPVFLNRAFAPLVWSTLQGNGPWDFFLPATRFMNPVLTNVVWIGALVLLERWNAIPSRKQTLFVALALGMLNYLYIYFWMVTMVVFGCLILRHFWKKEWETVKSGILIATLSLLISFPFWVVLRSGFLHAAYRITVDIPSRMPIFSFATLTIFLLFAAFLFFHLFIRRQGRYASLHFLFVLLLATIFATNQHVITGKLVQPHHFYYFTNLPIAALTLVLILGDVISSSAQNRWALRMGWVAFLFLLILGTGVQLSVLRKSWVEYQDRQRLASAFIQIQERGMPYVVLADYYRDAELIPMYTSADVFYAHHAVTYASTPMERRKEAWYVHAYLQGVRDLNAVRPWFASQRDRIGITVLEGQHYREVCGSYACFPDVLFEEIVQGYQQFLTRSDQQKFSHYRLDAILWDERRHPEWRVDTLKGFHRVWSGDGLSLWEKTTVDKPSLDRAAG